MMASAYHYMQNVWTEVVSSPMAFVNGFGRALPIAPQCVE